MTTSWEDVEDIEVIDKWRKEKIKLTTENGRSMWISRRALCIMQKALSSEADPYSNRNEEYDTKWVDGKGWDPPIEKARKRDEDEVICHYGGADIGKTLKERRKYRDECKSAATQLAIVFDMCPREMCPMEHCSAHC